MYRIEKTAYGYRLTFSGFIQAAEMEQWVEDSRRALAAAPEKFGVLVDMRTLKPLTADAQAVMQEGQELYKQKGMVRSAVVVDSAVTRMQFQRIAKASGIYQWERYIDGSSVENWEQVATDWITKAIDPDRQPVGA